MFSYFTSENFVHGGITLLCILGSFCTYFVSMWLKRKAETISKNSKINQFYEIDGIISGIVQESVSAMNQAYVEDLKFDGKFDKESALNAFNTVKRDVCNIISESTKQLISNYVEDFDAWITNKIENTVYCNKKSYITAKGECIEDECSDYEE